jgi:hypothetical protein
MAVDVISEITIARPRAEVAAYSADPDNATVWYENIESVGWESPPPLTVGNRLAFVARFWDDAWPTPTRSSTSCQASALRAHCVRAVPDGDDLHLAGRQRRRDATRMTLRNRGEPAGFATLSAPMVAAATRRANRKDLERLKRILEQPA